jgi:uncharacterized OB-fold protein
LTDMKNPHDDKPADSSTRPFREGLFSTDGKTPFLIANRCKACNRLFFPSRPFCFECFEREMIRCTIGRKGTLYSFTTCHMPSAHFKPPYTAGWIDLAEGVRIFAPIVAGPSGDLRIGMKMELVIDEICREGNTSIGGYKYRPE